MAQSGLIIASALLTSSVNLPLTRFRLESSVLLVIGGLALGAGFIARRRSAEIALMLAALLAAAIVAGGLCYRRVTRGDLSFGLLHPPRFWTSPTAWGEGEVGWDPVVGMVLPPNVVGRQVSEDFDVVYHSGPEGWRILPEPSKTPPDSEIWFLGCSFSFGAGVDDDESYIYRLARAWPESRVRNFSVSGYGTTNAYLNLKNQLSRRSKPTVVVYAWISHHQKRNYLRRSWHGSSNAAIIPRFEVVDGHLHWVGFVPGAQATLEDGPALDETEFRITVALIREMARLSRERSIPLVMLLLQGPDFRVPMAVADEPGISILDVSAVSNSFYPHDGHPTKMWHQSVARAIASHPLFASLTSNPKLHAPSAIPEIPMQGWAYWDGRKDGAVRCDYPRGLGDRLRLDLFPRLSLSSIFSKPSDVDPWQVQLRHKLSVRSGQEYQLELQIRSANSRRVELGVMQNYSPYESLGLRDSLTVSEEWQTIRRRFIADRDEQDAQFVIALGARRWIELREVKLWDGENDLLANRAAVLLQGFASLPAR